LTVFENLLVGAVHGRGLAERAAAAPCADILLRTGLIAHADTPVRSLTLLERKRLEMARALATGPQLLLLDEIAGGLTEAECGALIETIRDVHTAGTAIVWIEHIVHALLAVVGRLIVLDFGRKVAEGEPRQVMASPEVRQIYIGIEARHGRSRRHHHPSRAPWWSLCAVRRGLVAHLWHYAARPSCARQPSRA